jgi:transglutaminase-like putative cysteine protease
MASTLAIVPRHATKPYVDTTDTVERMEELASGPRGEQSLRLRMTVEDIVRHVKPKDRLSQAAAIYDWFRRRWSYINDPDEVELVKDPERILEEIATKGRALGDCDDASTFLAAACRTIGVPAEFVRVGFRKPGLSGPGKLSHVFTVVRDQYNRPVVIDPVAASRTPRMLRQASQAVHGLAPEGLAGGEDWLIAPVVMGLGAFLLVSMSWSGGR